MTAPRSPRSTSPRSTSRSGLRTTSLRRRVTLSVLAVLALVLFGVVLTVDAVFPVYARKDLSALLTTHVLQAEQYARQGDSPGTLVAQLDNEGVRARITMPDGSVYGTIASRIADPGSIVTRTAVLRTPAQYRGATLTLSADTSTVTAAQQRLRKILLLTALGAVALTAIVLIVTVRFALAPLEAMARLARSIAGGDRGWRLSPTRTDTELGRTAAAFDDMLDALEGAERHARAAADRTRRFVADAAHELRTPIAGVQAVAEAVLQQGPEADPEERERLHLLLVRESRRAGQLIDDLLDLARIDAGVELHHGPVELRTLAETEAARARLLAPGLTVDVDGPPLVVHADAARITQILANLMDNARQAVSNPTGGSDGRISVWIGQSGMFAELVVADDGPGVPAADRERIFDRLVRLDDARDRRSGGSGLGLAIARGFARAHGGDLTCEPPQPGGRGAVFRLRLPRASVSTVPVPTGPAGPTGPIQPVPGR